jgi:hypothetical protein
MGKKIMIDFGKVMVQHTFEGDPVAVDMRKQLGNKIHQTTGDIGFDDLARTIYFSEGEVEVPQEYIEPLKQLVKENYLVSVQRAFNELLTIKD